MIECQLVKVILLSIQRLKRRGLGGSPGAPVASTRFYKWRIALLDKGTELKCRQKRQAEMSWVGSEERALLQSQGRKKKAGRNPPGSGCRSGMGRRKKSRKTRARVTPAAEGWMEKGIW